MAEVFKCRLEGIGGFDKTVVLKCILQQHLSNQEFVQMFLDEARVAARLSHPNIVHIFEIGQVDEVPFIAMEYVAGPSLAMVNLRARKAKQIHVGHAARLIAGACHGLYHAHNAKDSSGEGLELVHRDVSPHNIVISSEGIPKLLDFGVAKTRGRLAVTQHGMLKGKFGYMSPEQLEGVEIDFRSDIFSIGVCLYLSTTGKLPFRGSSEVEVIAAGRKAVYQRPTEIVPGFPPELEDIIVTALQKDPTQRFPNARIMAERLEAFAAAGPHAVSGDSMVEWLTELFPEGLENTGQHELMPGVTPPSARMREGSGTGSSMGSRKTPRPLTGTSSKVAMTGGSLGGRQMMADEGMEVDLGTIHHQRSRRMLMVGGVVALALIAGAVGLYVRDSGEGSETAAARVYLGEAERMLREKKYELAFNLVERAESAGATDPELNVRVSQIRDKVELERALNEASKALDASNPKLALQRAQDALKRSPEHAEAKRISEEARSRLEAKPALRPPQTEPPKVAVVTPAPAQVVPASLSVTSSPAGTVFIDGSNAGRAPVRIKKMQPGPHVIEVRRPGYASARRDVVLGSGETETLRFSLSRAGSRSTVESSSPPPDTSAGEPLPPTEGTVVAMNTPVVEQKAPEVTPPPPPPPPLPMPPPPDTNSKVLTSSGTVQTPPPPPPPKPTYQPRLPRTARVRTMSDVLRTFQVIEAEAIRGGAPEGVARDSTRALSTELGRRMTAAEITEVYPMAMYSMIVQEAARGTSTSALGEKLKSAHASGTLKPK